MSELSIEELRRQVNEANAKAKSANLLLSAAKKRLHDGLCRKAGLIGKIATETRGRTMRVHDIEFIRENPWRLRGFKIRKDGAIGSQEIVMYVDSCFISDGLPSEVSA